MTTPLRELAGELTTINFGDGVSQTALRFRCPSAECQGHTMPYSDEGVDRQVRGGPVLVWRRVSGSTLDDLTLAPSFLVRGACGIHGHVVAGQWVPC